MIPEEDIGRLLREAGRPDPSAALCMRILKDAERVQEETLARRPRARSLSWASLQHWLEGKFPRPGYALSASGATLALLLLFTGSPAPLGPGRSTQEIAGTESNLEAGDGSDEEMELALWLAGWPEAVIEETRSS